MPYIWESRDWPHFRWDAADVYPNCYRYALNAGHLAREITPLSEQEREDAVIALMVAEAQKTSSIEGESVSARAVRAAIHKLLGRTATENRQNARARGIARLMVAARQHFSAALNAGSLCDWHKQFLGDLQEGAGRWRRQPVWIVSGPARDKRVDYEGPPATRVAEEMARFIEWFNASESLPGPVRAGVAHLYFECIHPFEDGNGRMGRAIAEIALSQEMGSGVLLSLSSVIEQRRQEYYAALKLASSCASTDITGWLEWWTQCVLDAQIEARNQFRCLVRRKQFWSAFREQVNSRQEKVLTHMLHEGSAGGEARMSANMSAKEYRRLTGCSKPTATRDLTALVRIGALKRLPGGGRSTRYAVQLPPL